MTPALHDLLNLTRLTEVLDVGASALGEDLPYAALLRARHCRVTGCEPDPEAFAKLDSGKGQLERYLPYAVGDGKMHELKICNEPGFTSLLDLDPAILHLFGTFDANTAIIKRVPMNTHRLDDIVEIEAFDFLKIDVQGSELSTFQNARRKLKHATFIQTEVSFLTFYKDQPTFGEVDAELRLQGFLPHAFADIRRWILSPTLLDGNHKRALNQVVEADMVYVRDISRMDTIPDEALKHLALIADACYGSVDLTVRCLLDLERRGVLPANTHSTYLSTVIIPR